MSAGSTGTLLVVEDDPDIARALSTYGTSRGFLCRVAEDGEQAVQQGSQQHFDVILLDISLPGKDGHAVLRELRQGHAVDDTVVIFLTAHDAQADRRAGLELGADDYETKPVHLATLFDKIDWLREKKGSRQI
jgi:DNA-binding response OmpR family regulator